MSETIFFCFWCFGGDVFCGCCSFIFILNCICNLFTSSCCLFFFAFWVVNMAFQLTLLLFFFSWQTLIWIAPFLLEIIAVSLDLIRVSSKLSSTKITLIWSDLNVAFVCIQSNTLKFMVQIEDTQELLRYCFPCF